MSEPIEIPVTTSGTKKLTPEEFTAIKAALVTVVELPEGLKTFSLSSLPNGDKYVRFTT